MLMGMAHSYMSLAHRFAKRRRTPSIVDSAQKTAGPFEDSCILVDYYKSPQSDSDVSSQNFGQYG